MKPVQWEPSCCMRTDRQTDRQDMTKLKSLSAILRARPKIVTIHNVTYRYVPLHTVTYRYIPLRTITHRTISEFDKKSISKAINKHEAHPLYSRRSLELGVCACGNVKVTHCSGIRVASSRSSQCMYTVVRLYLKCQLVCICDK